MYARFRLLPWMLSTVVFLLLDLSSQTIFFVEFCPHFPDAADNQECRENPQFPDPGSSIWCGWLWVLSCLNAALLHIKVCPQVFEISSWQSDKPPNEGTSVKWSQTCINVNTSPTPNPLPTTTSVSVSNIVKTTNHMTFVAQPMKLMMMMMCLVWRIRRDARGLPQHRGTLRGWEESSFGGKILLFQWTVLQGLMALYMCSFLAQLHYKKPG